LNICLGSNAFEGCVGGADADADAKFLVGGVDFVVDVGRGGPAGAEDVVCDVFEWFRLVVEYRGIAGFTDAAAAGEAFGNDLICGPSV